jgi:hypothetical protein
MWIAAPAAEEDNFPSPEWRFFPGVWNATHGRSVALGFVQINPNFVQIQAA